MKKNMIVIEFFRGMILADSEIRWLFMMQSFLASEIKKKMRKIILKLLSVLRELLLSSREIHE